MSARKLAVDLAALEPAQRHQLLAELPAHKRDELTRLIEELQPMLAEPSLFAAIMAEMNTSPARGTEFLHEFLQSETHLTQLLRGETIAVKKQLVDIFIGGQQQLVTNRVKSALIAYLSEQAKNLPYVAPAVARKKTGWARFWK